MLQVFFAEDPEIEYLFCGVLPALKPALSFSPGYKGKLFFSSPVSV